MISFQVKKLEDNATIPAKGNPTDAGIDVFTNESKTLAPGERYTFGTGIAVAIPEGYVALLWDRSGLGSRGVHRLAGVIDAGYRGEWKIVVVNLADEPVEIAAGDKIVQCVLQEFTPANIEEVEELPESVRGGQGFGSSGR